MRRLRPNQLIDRDCGDCGITFQGFTLGSPSTRCPSCRIDHKRRYNRELEKKAKPKPFPLLRNFPALVGGYPVLSRGWFRENLAARHTAQSLAYLTGVHLKRIRLEISYIREPGPVKEGQPFPYVLTHNIRHLPAKSKFKNPNLGVLKAGA